MGVPSLFRWLSRKYPQIIIKAEPENATDNLYIDFNAIIHISATPHDGPNKEDVDGIMKNIAKNLDKIIYHCRPKKLLYISTDGVAPRAKLIQQRSRRYRTVYEKKLELDKLQSNKEIKKNSENESRKSIKINSENNSSMAGEYRVDFTGLLKDFDLEEKKQQTTTDQSSIDEFGKHLSDIGERESEEMNQIFDSNSITPGTRFMYDLEIKVDEFIQNRLKTHDHYKHLSVIYSNGRRAGEGEQKIMSVIRKMRNKNLKHTIYSPDADLIFLGTSLHGKIVKIMREDLDFIQTQKKYKCDNCNKDGHLTTYCNNLMLYSCIYIDIPVLKNILHSELSSLIKVNFDFPRIVDDWIFMSFLAGNDFLPSLQCFDVRFEAIEVLTRLLARNFNQTRRYITYQGELNFHVLINLFKILSEEEDYLYAKKKQDLDRARARFQCKGYFESILLNTYYGKTKYYSKKLNLSSEKDVIKVCRDYILGLSWIYNYYIKGITHWDWFYPHDYAPFALDLCTIRNMPFLNSKSQPCDCLEQQVFIMPPQSKNLVPKEMHQIFDNFPNEIKVDMFDKLLPWQGVVILPMVDFKNISTQIKQKRTKIKYEDILPCLESSDLFYMTKNSIYNKANRNAKENNSLFTSLKLIYEKSLPLHKANIDFDAYFTPFYQYSMENNDLVITQIKE